MQVSIKGYDSPVRWHAKVARQAEASLNSILAIFDPVQKLEFYAEFDPQEAKTVQVVEHHQGQQVSFHVVFAASDWATISEAVEPAIAQLAVAVLSRLDAKKAAALHNRLKDSGVALPPVQRRRVVQQVDPRDHATITVRDGMPIEKFLELTDTLDRALSDRKLGEISGTGAGVLGFTLDVSSTRLQESLEVVEAFLRSNDVFDFQRL